mgnify:FL=1
MKKDFEVMFKEWFEIVGFQDPQHYQDLDWDWSEEIDKFIEDPEKEHSYQLAVKQEDDAHLAEENIFNNEESQEYFTNSFGIKMKRQKK